MAVTMMALSAEGTNRRRARISVVSEGWPSATRIAPSAATASAERPRSASLMRPSAPCRLLRKAYAAWRARGLARLRPAGMPPTRRVGPPGPTPRARHRTRPARVASAGPRSAAPFPGPRPTCASTLRVPAAAAALEPVFTVLSLVDNQAIASGASAQVQLDPLPGVVLEVRSAS